MIFRCPCCNVISDLEHVFADETARKTMALIAKLPKDQAYPLVQYVGFFRPKKSAMSWDRVHKLISEASTLAGYLELNAALATTIEALRAKQKTGEWTPLKNHAYLKKVISSQPEIQPVQPYSAAPTQTRSVPPVSSAPGPAKYVTEERKAHRSPEEKRQAAHSISKIMSTIGVMKAEEKAAEESGGKADGNGRVEA